MLEYFIKQLQINHSFQSQILFSPSMQTQNHTSFSCAQYLGSHNSQFSQDVNSYVDICALLYQLL